MEKENKSLKQENLNLRKKFEILKQKLEILLEEFSSEELGKKQIVLFLEYYLIQYIMTIICK